MDNRRNSMLDGLNLGGVGLEIGAGYGPLVAGTPGLNVRTLDYLDQKGLIQKYESIGVDTTHILPVDYVWSGQRYRDLVKEDRFDWIIASHVIEHVPDIVGFLCECAEILKPNGVLSLAIPDKRLEFDFYRPPSGLGAMIDAHLSGRKAPSPGVAAEFTLYAARLDGQDTWDRANQRLPVFAHEKVGFSRAVAEAVQGGEYLDVHVWVCTPNSFRAAAEDLFQLGYSPLRECRFEAPETHEFFIQLSRTGTGPQIPRHELYALACSESAGYEQPPGAPAHDRMDPNARVAALEMHAQALERERREILASSSWRITAPLRWMSRQARRSGRRPLSE